MEEAAEKPGGFSPARARSEFPELATCLNGHPLVYLDNAATMQVPACVTDALVDFYQHDNANVHRGAHELSERATAHYEEARASIARFIGALPTECVLTSGTTDSLNRAAALLASRVAPGDEVLVPVMEHHSNMLPWRHLARSVGASIVTAPVDSSGTLDEEAFSSLLSARTKVVVLTQVSNVTGVPAPVARLCAEVHARTAAVCVVDGAQGIVHARAPMDALGCDLYAFSGHKLGGPTGTGVLFVRKSLLDELEPTCFGGGAVVSVDEVGERFAASPWRFEPGTPNYAGFVGLQAALAWWDGQPSATVASHERTLLERLEAGLDAISDVRVLGATSERCGSLSFAVNVGSSFDWCKLLDAQGVAVRSGHHCAEPYHRALGCADSVRVSVAPYNTEGDVDVCLAALARAHDVLRGEGEGRVRGRIRR